VKTPEAHVQDEDEDQGNEDDKDNEITDQARELRRLEQYQQYIIRL
jgi:hypothetical protein